MYEINNDNGTLYRLTFNSEGKKYRIKADTGGNIMEKENFRVLLLQIRQGSKASQLGFWERMFSAWHVLHVPLFFLLLVSGVIHVVAVHLY